MGSFGYCLFCWKLKTIKKKNFKVTVHAFGTIHKPKITVHGQWIMPDARLGKKNAKNATQGTQYPNATYILMQFSFFSLLKLHNLVLSLKKKNQFSVIQTEILGCHSMSPCLSYAVCGLKLLGFLGKTEASLRSFNLSLFYHQFLSFPQIFTKNLSALSLSFSWGQDIPPNLPYISLQQMNKS